MCVFAYSLCVALRVFGSPTLLGRFLRSPLEQWASVEERRRERRTTWRKRRRVFFVLVVRVSGLVGYQRSSKGRSRRESATKGALRLRPACCLLEVVKLLANQLPPASNFVSLCATCKKDKWNTPASKCGAFRLKPAGRALWPLGSRSRVRILNQEIGGG